MLLNMQASLADFSLCSSNYSCSACAFAKSWRAAVDERPRKVYIFVSPRTAETIGSSSREVRGRE